MGNSITPPPMRRRRLRQLQSVQAPAVVFGFAIAAGREVSAGGGRGMFFMMGGGGADIFFNFFLFYFPCGG